MVKNYPYTIIAKVPRTGWHKRCREIRLWLFENIGEPYKAWVTGDRLSYNKADEVWVIGEFVPYGETETAIRIHFKHEQDAVLSALRWA